MKVKICGITNLEDALAAIEAGADLLGFVFAKSVRNIDPLIASDIITHLSGDIITVGVFAGQDVDMIADIVNATRVDYAQIHDYDERDVKALAQKIGYNRIIRAFNIATRDDITRIELTARKSECRAFLLDTAIKGMSGGTGQRFEWEMAAHLKSLGKPIILAGGLTPENVSEGIAIVRPSAVDVSSGVEIRPGKKDHNKIREFIENAREPI